MRREDLAHDAGDALARERLLRKDVTEPAWCACYHACPSPLFVRRAYRSATTEIAARVVWRAVVSRALSFSCVVTLAY